MRRGGAAGGVGWPVFVPRPRVPVARLAAETATQTAAIFYTSMADERLVREALAVDARGVGLKSASAANLLDAIRAVPRGETYIDPRLRSPGSNDPSTAENQSSREQ